MVYMTTETMTIHEALSELKVLGDRIEKEIGNTEFVETNKHSNTKIDGKSISDYSNGVKSQHQKITDLIKRRIALKRAVTLSNATTKVTINNTEMTVAEAIEYKNTGISYQAYLMHKLSNDYQEAILNIKSKNGDRLEDKANDYIQKLYGNRDGSVDNATIENAKKAFIESNTLDMIDPINAEKVIEQLKDEIDNFTCKVDSALSVSNATTTIEISY